LPIAKPAERRAARVDVKQEAGGFTITQRVRASADVRADYEKVLAALPPTDTPALVRAAQNELRRIGCFAGENDGKFTDKTRDAVRRYLTQRGQSLDDIKISEALVAEFIA
jgi:peptidoglycan hydrolase-like protein with peptidoglycan-binding domain